MRISLPLAKVDPASLIASSNLADLVGDSLIKGARLQNLVLSQGGTRRWVVDVAEAPAAPVGDGMRTRRESAGGRVRERERERESCRTDTDEFNAGGIEKWTGDDIILTGVQAAGAGATRPTPRLEQQLTNRPERRHRSSRAKQKRRSCRACRKRRRHTTGAHRRPRKRSFGNRHLKSNLPRTTSHGDPHQPCNRKGLRRGDETQ